MKNKPFGQAVFTLFGTIVGTGILVLPYVIYQVGFWYGAACLLLIGLTNWLLNLTYTKVILATKGDHQLSGYAKIYLGKWGWILGGLFILINVNGALLAYLVGLGKFLHILVPMIPSFYFGIFFFLLAFSVVFRGIKVVGKFNEILIGGLFLLLLIFFIWGGARINYGNFNFLSQGGFVNAIAIIFFAYAGFTVIPEVEQILRSQPKKLVSAVTWGSLLPIILYFVFVIVTIGVLGNRVTPDFVSGIKTVSKPIFYVAILLGILAIVTSYFSLAFSLKEFWQRDLKFSKLTSISLTFLPLFFLYIFNQKGFLEILAITGGISTVLMTIIIFGCWRQVKKGNS